MRLTLRTLLAHEHGLLNEQQAELISQKIERSPFVAQLLRHLKDRAARREIVPLTIEARGTVCLETITRYLDYTLPAEEVVKLENECFASDRLLAEVASCHEIISQWLATPTPIEPALRQRLYAVMPGPMGNNPAASDELAIDLPALGYQSSLPSTPLVEKQVADRPVPAKSGWVGGAFRLFALAASVLILVTCVTMNRGKVESMIVQHWQGKSPVAFQPQDVPDVPARKNAPDMLVSTSEPMTPIEATPPTAAVPALLSEVATTAFHIPIPIDQSAPVAKAWNVEEACGTAHLGSHDGAWQAAEFKQLTTGRVVVIPGGQCRLHRAGLQLEVREISELSLSGDGIARLRYGSLVVNIESGREFMLDVAGQQVKVMAALNEPARLVLSTRAVVSRGLDFAANTSNQEVHFEGISGEAELTIPGCRGPIPLEQGQRVIAHMNHGVRGGDTIALNERINKVQVTPLAKAMQNSGNPVGYLRDSLSSEMPDPRLDATIALAQLGQADAWADAWSQDQDQQSLEPHLVDVQELMTQDSALALDMKNVLSLQSPEHGPLIYRLICGFSDDQLTDETRMQLDTLLGHPVPAVRAWTHFQLSKRQIR